MYDLVTFGEILLRMEAPAYQRIEQADRFTVRATGSEMNSCVLASRLGLKTAHVTKLPANALGRKALNATREHGIDTRHFLWSDRGRIGLYFLEFGSHPRPNEVLYDRSDSVMTTLKPGEVDWDPLLKETKILHFCATLPALGKTAQEATRECLKKAKAHNVTVSFDLNYRAKLWSIEKAGEVIRPLMEYVDILITPKGVACSIFDISPEDDRRTAKKLHEELNLEVVALTLRESITVSRNNWTSVAYADGRFYDDVKYEIELVDRVGGGDAFTGGFLYAFIEHNRDIQSSLQYGNASAALKQTIPGDLNWSTRDETEDLIKQSSVGNEKMKLWIKR